MEILNALVNLEPQVGSSLPPRFDEELTLGDAVEAIAQRSWYPYCVARDIDPSPITNRSFPERGYLYRVERYRDPVDTKYQIRLGATFMAAESDRPGEKRMAEIVKLESGTFSFFGKTEYD